MQTLPIRLVILGPKGSGKTLLGRHLATKLGLYHIQFRNRLEELIAAKKKIVDEDDPPEEPETKEAE